VALIAEGAGHTYATGTEVAQPALRGVDLTLEPGQLLLVVGPTGSGKSTLLAACAALLVPSEGRVSVDGVPVDRRSAPSLNGAVGLVFQDPESQFFAETVEADVAFGPRNLGSDAADAIRLAREALGAVGLDPDTFGPRSPFALSGGEARRAAIAGVLAMRPRYLLLDEPTSGLDSRGRAAVRDAVDSARRTAGVVVVSHDPEEFLAAADLLLALREGRPAWQGRVGDLLRDPGPALAAGVQLPETLCLQILARERGLDVPRLELDPESAADRLAKAAGWSA
jgi:energy-coupling factor transport system ATP-binding protein